MTQANVCYRLRFTPFVPSSFARASLNGKLLQDSRHATRAVGLNSGFSSSVDR